MESREELLVLLQFDNNTVKTKQISNKVLKFLNPCSFKMDWDVEYCVAKCQPVNIIISQEGLECDRVFCGRHQSGYMVDKLRRRNFAVWNHNHILFIIYILVHQSPNAILAEGHLVPIHLGGSSSCWSSLQAWCRPHSYEGTPQWARSRQTVSGSVKPWSSECI